MFKLLFALLWITDLQPVSSVELTYSCDGVLGGMPGHVNLTLTTSPNGKRTFTLTHVDQFDLDTDLFTMTTHQDGSLRYQKESLVHDQNTAFYQDGTNAGVFKVVRTDRTMSTRPQLQFEGQFLLGNFTYTLGAKKRVRRDVPSSVHSPEVVYTLRKQARRKKHLLYDDVDSSNVSEDLKTTMKFLTPARRSRRAPATYYIDIAAVVDFKSYSSFLNRYLDRANALREILEYYSYVIAGVDLLYQGITSTEYRIRVRLIKVIVAEVASASPFTEDNSFGTFLVHVDAALDDFREFLAGSGRPLVEPYDHAMLFTMYDLRISSAKYSYWYTIDIVGKAVLGKMCAQDGLSSSLVKDEGEFSSIEVAAHELAHSLSAQHDGINNTCNYDDAYIMAPESSSNPHERNANAWRFSNCTLQYFGSFFQELLRSRDGASCLTGQIPKSSNLPDDNGGLRGLKYPARAQCRIRLGDESTLAYNERNDFLSFTPSSLCLAMWCKEYEWLLSLTHVGPPFPGTPCDDGKLCLYGECVHHPKAPKYVCVFGDVPNFNCSQEVSTNPVLCSSKIFKLVCCESCSAHHKALESENLHSVTSTMASVKEPENLPSCNSHDGVSKRTREPSQCNSHDGVSKRTRETSQCNYNDFESKRTREPSRCNYHDGQVNRA
ncbi:unnamed protein product [Lymnaea stagnalis]|uniref:Peptidase M12B domain-containing protein n=1 Tax=Lymnaea stagnalis TaxID=6523 RepID=A0AAV2IFK2_LYMST